MATSMNTARLVGGTALASKRYVIGGEGLHPLRVTESGMVSRQVSLMRPLQCTINETHRIR
eukprot:5041394-Pyramimonas_sp.AAC.3